MFYFFSTLEIMIGFVNRNSPEFSLYLVVTMYKFFIYVVYPYGIVSQLCFTMNVGPVCISRIQRNRHRGQVSICPAQNHRLPLDLPRILLSTLIPENRGVQ